MTKQEQIEEIAKTMCEEFGTDTCKFDCPCRDDCANNDISERLYNAGYRKTFTSDLASDTQKALKEEYEKVRKETAKEILNDLYFNLQSSVKGNVCKSNDCYNVIGWIKEIAKEYGVEVEE